jgi:Tol biopolymer transport system component
LLLREDIASPEDIYLYDVLDKQLSCHITEPADRRKVYPIFSEDGKFIVFSSLSEDGYRVENPVWVYSLVDSSLQNLELIITYEYIRILRWDNASFLYIDSGPKAYIYNLNSNTVQMIDYGRPNYPKKSALGGQYLIGIQINERVITSVRESHYWLFDLDGHLLTQLTFYPEKVLGCELSPDGSYLAFEGYRNIPARHHSVYIIPVGDIISGL